jgi:hypothetical protein
MELKKLALPFPEEDIEWRIAQAGKRGNGQVWAQVLAYVQARAIMNRLDEVCGPENWRATYRFIPGAQGMDAGVICELSIKIGDEWVTKEDGAEQTDIESFKGGISSALKRAGSAWGIGRYLYNLESNFAKILDGKNEGGRYGKTKDGLEFYWLPPNLPGWALPDPSKAKTNGVKPEAPSEDDGHRVDRGYVIDFGKWNKRTLEEVYRNEGPGAITGYISYLEDFATKNNKPLSASAVRFISEAERFIGAMENSPPRAAG